MDHTIAGISAPGTDTAPPAEMASRVAEYDWSQTPLGPINSWPRSLQTAVNICLHSRFPMFVWWGPDLINIYNDAYSLILGKRHPKALGMPARAIWTELWSLIAEDVAAVMGRGEGVIHPRERLILECNGYPEERYFTYAHSPIPDDDGNVGGLFQVCYDETATVLAEKERDRLLAETLELAATVKRQAAILDTALTHINDFAYLFDLDGRFVYANRPLLDLWGIGLEQAVGKNFFDLHYPHELASKLQDQIRQVISTRRQVIDETPYTSPSGVPGYYEYIFTPIFGADGRIEAVAGSTRDIARRKALEDDRLQLFNALEAERANLAAIFEKAPAFIVTLRGPTHLIELANEEYYNLIGRSDIIGKTILEALPEIAGQGFIELLDNVFRTGEPFFGSEVPVVLAPKGAAERHVVNFVYQALRGADGVISGIFVHGVDVTNMVRSREILEAREANFRQLADAMPQIVWTARPDGVLDYYNRRWFEYINLPQDAGGEAAWDQFVHPQDLPRVGAEWAACLKSGDPYSLEFRVRGGDGVYRTFLVRALAVRDDKNAISRWLGTCTDITDLKLIEAEREQLLTSERAARSEAEQQSRMKDEFLATLSHEIRTPLNAILGWSQIMRTSKDPEDIAGGLEVIERNARAQTQIIEDLLDMSRIISGKVRLDVQRLDLATIVQTAVETARPTAQTKGVRLRSVVDPLHGVTVSGDANRVQQVLWNLISNAIKFTPRDGQIQVLLERVNSHLEISVIDTGEGINPEFLPYVFDRFRQADASTTRRHGGLGLGLSIVKQLVELHGGSVRVNSAGAGHGATFVVSLPMMVVHVEQELEVERRHPRVSQGRTGMHDSCSEIAGVRVLVIDDEPDARALVKRLLEDCKAAVTITDSVSEAVRLVATGKFDVLVSDVGMPREDGYSLIRKVRLLGKEKGGDIPAIALTAYARAEDRVKAVAAGFQMHVAKPVEPLELITMVAGAAGRTGPGAN